MGSRGDGYPRASRVPLRIPVERGCYGGLKAYGAGNKAWGFGFITRLYRLCEFRHGKMEGFLGNPKS